MKEIVILVENRDDWSDFYPTDQVIPVKEYIFGLPYQEHPQLYVINLCHNLKYLSLGHYASLLAEARRHKCLPSIQSINDLRRQSFYKIDLDDANKKLEKLSHSKAKCHTFEGRKEIIFKSFFGHCPDHDLLEVAQNIFDIFKIPICEVTLVKKLNWEIDNVHILSLKELADLEKTYFAEALDQFSAKIWRSPRAKKAFKYDLAILVDLKEALVPSNEKALLKFEQACHKYQVYCERIQRKDYARLSEFDALFIRETTTVENHTYRFSKKAQEEGLVVIDDPQSILRCTNKIYMSNLFSRKRIPHIPSAYVSSLESEKDFQKLTGIAEKFGYPMVLKIPDSSFSRGMKKVQNFDELLDGVEEMLKHTALVLVQKFVFTPFDWRVGILSGQPLFVCRYYMSRGHWQIYNHSSKKSGDRNGKVDTLDISEAPPHVIEAAIKAAKHIGDGLYGVDLKEVDGEAFVVEINDNPNIDAGVEDIFLKNKLYEMIITDIIERIEKKRKIGLKKM